MICRRLIWLLLPLLLPAAAGEIRAVQNSQLEGPSSTNVWNPQLAAEIASLFQQLPGPVIHEAGLTSLQAAQQLQSDARYQQLVREKLQRQWFAALVTTEPAEPYSITTRFGSWREMTEFLA